MTGAEPVRHFEGIRPPTQQVRPGFTVKVEYWPTLVHQLRAVRDAVDLPAGREEAVSRHTKPKLARLWVEFAASHEVSPWLYGWMAYMWYVLCLSQHPSPAAEHSYAKSSEYRTKWDDFIARSSVDSDTCSQEISAAHRAAENVMPSLRSDA